VHLLVVALVAGSLVGACKRSEPARTLDLDLIEIQGAHMRTDRVGEGEFESNATFVLVDARNRGDEGAYVTIDGELLDASGGQVAELIPQVLWLPPGEPRTYALVDSERKPRPTATSARARVRGALILPPPLARIEELHTFDDHGQIVLQAYLVNEADRDGYILVTAAFHDDRGRPLTRPFSVVKIKAAAPGDQPGDCPDAASRRLPQASKCTIQFVGPPGATRGTMFVGDVTY
jgi:hypothetical protein